MNHLYESLGALRRFTSLKSVVGFMAGGGGEGAELEERRAGAVAIELCIVCSLTSRLFCAQV